MQLRNKINKVRKSKDGKVLVENFAYLTLLQVAGYIFPLITLPYLARVIGVDSFGKIAFAAAIIGWFQTVADWGFNFTATRDVAKNRVCNNIIYYDINWPYPPNIMDNIMEENQIVTLLNKLKEIYETNNSRNSEN